ncbi:MAG: class I SAM-dependent rRNA methyltransferase [Elusimicrobia bacterium]|nr:class I SAM-dependent rRNA methyltransferase [Elusimicrobiota bacterium]
MNPEKIILKPHEDRRIRRGHLWVFSNEIQTVPPNVAAGDVVHFYTAREEFLGTGYYNPHSLIAGRVLDRHPVEVDEAFFEGRLRRAMDWRKTLYSDNSSAYRWVFGESDDLPGLVIDRYGDVCAIEAYSAGIDKLLPTIVKAVKTIFPWKAVVLRNDVAPRRLEHLEESVQVLEGTIDTPHWFETNGLRVGADLLKGQKTGFFFDQRSNRAAVAAHASGKKMLDLFCHTGGFSLWAAKAGASSAVGVDDSEAALEIARLNAEANKFQSLMTFEKADVFDWLALSKDLFDIVVVDPPNFVPSKKQLPAAIEAYIRLNMLALKRVKGDGLLASAVCAQHVGRDDFRQILARAAYAAGRRARLIFWGSQAPDHPIRLAMPETEYLKSAILHVS